MDRKGFQGWLDRYVDAWKTYDPDAIGALFSADAKYRYHPQDEPLTGRAAIVGNWLEDKDDAGTYDAHYDVVAIDGDVHVANGWSRYFEKNGQPRDEYLNVYICQFNAAGECTDFTEYWIQNREFRRRAMEEMISKAKVDESEEAA